MLPITPLLFRSRSSWRLFSFLHRLKDKTKSANGHIQRDESTDLQISVRTKKVHLPPVDMRVETIFIGIYKHPY